MPTAEPPDRTTGLETLFREQRSRLWGLAYRMTGSAADADDVVQEAFARLLAQPPDAPPAAFGRWLARVATNLAIDALRRRRRTPYTGSWLPEPIETAAADRLDAQPGLGADPELRYGLAESASYAFLVALEALGPRQRAVLLLRDVLGHTASEAAELLGTSEGNVRILHLRARRSLEAYDEERCVPTPELRERHRVALQRFLDCLAAQDPRGLEALLAESVRTVTDAGGEYTALATPLEGRARVARLYLAAAMHRRAAGARTEIRLVNGLPAAWITLERPVRRQAPRTLLRCELDARGAIRVVHAILAPRKLAALGAP
ncbi:MAG TPA: sigma-70 family RNA polymerase sigma factor [Myxococcota bacterium]|nr:sigma-70 family RNA polymerase sigma factor [Myxococcota bacterium]